ncbi:Yvc1p ASCRUDRAFT_55866 [Ascoidea rubescens DSM 1968]|uniref:Ion transport domain-containing protein n=1 Tax=Ascoidea rubescens DSM 1968 TaxID=1344418 RepID=A0A1D2VLT4_9ASCO|nr:hypothetical protein ASCRUDRAFT_55866 [Ascoidea rubescens DSM 1968]ODV62544.1 hypothetical protein ASCRUDRAFT_55866 [Ascoidea rubescens DSM 1968]
MDIEVPYSSLIDDVESTEFPVPSPRQVLRIALNVKYVIDQIIQIQYEPDLLTCPDSRIINQKAVRLVLEAAGGKGDGAPNSSSRKYRAPLIFCLLKICWWNYKLSLTELHDAELYQSRLIASQQLAKLIIENEEDEKYLFINMLCKRYRITLNDRDSVPLNALELAVDQHSTIIIGSSGYQRCMKWLWRGWIVQSENDPSSYELYKDISSTSFLKHFNPDRIKSPLYQYILEIFFSLVYLLIFTFVINSHVGSNSMTAFETLFIIFTAGLILDEITKLYHVGYYYIGFWNVFNDFMYILIIIWFVIRCYGLSKDTSELRDKYDEFSYYILSCVSPLIWSRLLLYLDAQKFVGVMIVVLKVMMKESALFFFLLVIVIAGFLQGFIGLDTADGKRDVTDLVVGVMLRTVIDGGEFDVLDQFTPPFGNLLYSIYAFVVAVILLNILVALYNTAYQDIYDNALDEFMAIVAHKTLRYIRAPDENVFVPPLNLIEIAVIPLGWFLDKRNYKYINDTLMSFLYSPFLLYISFREVKDAKRVQYNRFKKTCDDANEYDYEWDLQDGYYSGDEDLQDAQNRIARGLRAQNLAESSDPEFLIDFKSFKKKVQNLVPPIEKGEDSGVGWQQYALYKKIEDLTDLVFELKEEIKTLKTKNE